MPKKNSLANIPRTTRSTTAAIIGGQGNFGSSLPALSPIVVELVDLNLDILPELQVGFPMVLSNQNLQIQVFTPLGTYVGSLSAEDTTRTRLYDPKGAYIADARIEPAMVLLEVLV